MTASSNAQRSVDGPEGARPSLGVFKRPENLACVVIVIDNLQRVSDAYGAGVAGFVKIEIQRRARLFSWDRGGISCLGEDRILLVLRDMVELADAALHEQAGLLGRVLFALGNEPIHAAGTTIIPVLSAYLEQDGREQIAMGPSGPDGSAEGNGGYRADMDAAAQVFSAMTAGRLRLVRQPIRGANAPDATLYSECLLRLVDHAGDIYEPSRLVRAIERLGLSIQLDAWVLRQTIRQLAREPQLHLGCNISAASAVEDPRWEAIFHRLMQRSDVAARLVVEVTEGTPYPVLQRVVDFTSRLREAGCQIAIGDFGARNSSIDTALALRPDILKIDRFFLTLALADEGRAAALTHLLGLAGTLAQAVVVEGVHTHEHRDIALQAGAQWLQGFAIESPALVSTALEEDLVIQGGGDPS